MERLRSHDGNERALLCPACECVTGRLGAADHFYRRLEQTLDLSFVREFVANSILSHSGKYCVHHRLSANLQISLTPRSISSSEAARDIRTWWSATSPKQLPGATATLRARSRSKANYRPSRLVPLGLVTSAFLSSAYEPRISQYLCL